MNISEAKALTPGQWLHNPHEKPMSDGSPYRVRVNGKPKTWKTQPNRVQIPIKFGLYSHGYITDATIGDWRLGYGGEDDD